MNTDRKRIAIWVGVVVLLLAAAAAVGRWTGNDDSSDDTTTSSSTTETVAAEGQPDVTASDEEAVTAVIDNRVTNGPTLMREDDAPACLTETPRNFCQDVVVTDLGSGDEILLLCQTTSERTTNGNDSDVADDQNPGLYTSDPGLWYWARYEGDEGYISEVWVESDKRGGAGQPRCG
jgi:hypothetical protein